ncbi:MAG: peptide chain release factor N(5)-glutamine methyltransferase [Deltaproteobacteria bacterium]|nr:peptide chain release factor N(5)-glutamine methyltransferase [Deltaproteobacteria bacterium]
MSTPDWTVLGLITTTADFLAKKGSSSGRLDAELLLGRALAMDRVALYCAFDRPVAPRELDAYRELVRRRAAGEPVAYILGRKEFFSITFHVSPAVLIPRPETEHLVERALALLPESETRRVLDVGTGSGAVAVCVAKHRAGADVAATDISSEALEVARLNAAALGVAERIQFHNADLFGDLAGPFDLVLSNPPYVRGEDWAKLTRDVADFEPRTALVAENRGLEVISRLIREAPPRLATGGRLVMEIGHDQADDVAGLFAQSGLYEPAEFFKDNAGRKRIVEGRLKET